MQFAVWSGSCSLTNNQQILPGPSAALASGRKYSISYLSTWRKYSISYLSTWELHHVLPDHMGITAYPSYHTEQKVARPDCIRRLAHLYEEPRRYIWLEFEMLVCGTYTPESGVCFTSFIKALYRNKKLLHQPRGMSFLSYTSISQTCVRTGPEPLCSQVLPGSVCGWNRKVTKLELPELISLCFILFLE